MGLSGGSISGEHVPLYGVCRNTLRRRHPRTQARVRSLSCQHEQKDADSNFLHFMGAHDRIKPILYLRQSIQDDHRASCRLIRHRIFNRAKGDGCGEVRTSSNKACATSSQLELTGTDCRPRDTTRDPSATAARFICSVQQRLGKPIISDQCLLAQDTEQIDPVSTKQRRLASFVGPESYVAVQDLYVRRL